MPVREKFPLEKRITADFEFFPDEPRAWPKRRPRRLRQPSRPRLTERQILAWAKAHCERTGKWPTCSDTAVFDAAGESWSALDLALARGYRGLPGGTTLARLLARHYRKTNRAALPRLSIRRILTWADQYHARTGRWPQATCGSIGGSAQETWSRINASLQKGCRGLKCRISLAQLLARHRRVRNIHRLPRLSVPQILAWADDHLRRTGRWPTQSCGAIQAAGAEGERWYDVNHALQHGRRGLPGGLSLARLLSKHRDKRNHLALPRLTIKQILAWADAHHAKTGRWPNCHLGRVQAAPQESWAGIDKALNQGRRGLPSYDSLAQLLAKRRGVRNVQRLPPLSVKQVLAWVDHHFHRTGKWPAQASGNVKAAKGEKWFNVDQALRKGLRGFPGGSSLAQLLDRYRCRPPRSRDHHATSR